MATKKDNAALILAALGLTLDHESSSLKADLLENWAGRLDTDKEGVRRDVLSYQLQKVVGVEITDPNLTPEQLQEWLDRAVTDPDGVKAEIEGQAVAAPADATTPLLVQVSERVAAYGGTFTDPEQAEGSRVIGEDPVEVQMTALITQGLKNGTLVEAE